MARLPPSGNTPQLLFHLTISFLLFNVAVFGLLYSNARHINKLSQSKRLGSLTMSPGILQSTTTTPANKTLSGRAARRLFSTNRERRKKCMRAFVSFIGLLQGVNCVDNNHHQSNGREGLFCRIIILYYLWVVVRKTATAITRAPAITAPTSSASTTFPNLFPINYCRMIMFHLFISLTECNKWRWCWESVSLRAIMREGRVEILGERVPLIHTRKLSMGY